MVIYGVVHLVVRDFAPVSGVSFVNIKKKQFRTQVATHGVPTQLQINYSFVVKLHV